MESEVKMEKQYKVGDGQLKVIIQSGENVWTILYADGSSDYKDVCDTTENNCKAALEVLNAHFSDINEI